MWSSISLIGIGRRYANSRSHRPVNCCWLLVMLEPTLSFADPPVSRGNCERRRTLRLDRYERLQVLKRRYLSAQQIDLDGKRVTLFAGVWAIFGHGNVAGIGEALQAHREFLPTYRTHNEQAMALAAIGYAKAMHRRRIMACTTSIGPGATNMVTAAAVAHVDRLRSCCCPVTCSRRAGLTRCCSRSRASAMALSRERLFRPVSRYFDRITRAEQIHRGTAARRRAADRSGRVRSRHAGAVSGYPSRSVRLSRKLLRRPCLAGAAAAGRMDRACGSRARVARRQAPLIIAGGGVHYSERPRAGRFTSAHGIPVTETQAGRVHCRTIIR